ncbi:restriction endonuclease subunit S [Flavobacterium sp. CAU 1735]|uniref:restriction endonuclease subunit S n=1 Tax=Flavobacterium sp. CAU 1735 TaxID=3140361 RepID=UPI0032609971
MDTKKLRQKILDLAIRGKLVPQDPNDEPASVLIEKIRVEKERLIKEKKIKRDKNESYIYRSDKSYYEKFADGTVKCIDQEIPFEIPESWEWCRLGSITQHNTGKTLDKGRNTGELFEYITTSNIYWEGFELNTLKKMLIEESGIDRFTVRKGDLLVCEGGDSGRSAVWEYERTICFQNHVHRVRPYLNIESWYIYFFLHKIYLSKEIDQYKKGVGIQSLSGEALSSILLPLPPTKEQQQIILEINQCNSFVEIIEQNQGRLQQIVKNTKSKILDLAIKGKLVPQDPNDEPAFVLLERIKAEHPDSKKKTKKTSDNSHYTMEVPQGWSICMLGDLFKFIRNGITISQNKEMKGIPITRIETISNGMINREKMGYANIIDINKYSDYYLKENDILMSHINSPIHVGKSAICEYLQNEEKIIHGMNLLCFRPIENLNAKYISWYFKSPVFNESIQPYIKNAVNQASINISNLNSLIVILPPFNEQKRIVLKIEEIFVSLDKIVNSIKA